MKNGGFVIEILFVFEHGQSVFMDIVDYINEVDRSNREQEAAYHVTL